jgi:effector-binding domain-containing protein
MDTTMEKSYEGPEAGVGAIYRWSGNDSVGTGVLEITESVPHEYIKSTLTFTAPWESESTVEWDFVETDGGVMASWAVNGELPGYLFWMGEKAANMPGTPMSVIEIEAMPVYFIEAETSIKNMESSFFGDKYEKIGAYLGADTQNMLESPLAIYKVWDEENDKAQVAVGMACESEKPGEGDIQKVMSHEGKAVECEYMGSYEGGKGAHNAIAAYMETNSLEMVGPPWEVYVTGPANEPDSTKWVTRIYYPIL